MYRVRMHYEIKNLVAVNDTSITWVFVSGTEVEVPCDTLAAANRVLMNAKLYWDDPWPTPYIV